MNDTREKLIQICLRPEYRVESTDNEIVPLPYIPYIPDGWNKILVLFEAQNLSGFSDGNTNYLDSLMKASESDQVNRLNNPVIKSNKDGGGIGISPWDEGWLDLALLSVFPDQEETGKDTGQ